MSKTLEVIFKANTQHFTKGVSHMSNSLSRLTNMTQKVNSTTGQIANATNKATTATNKAANATNNWSNNTNKVNNGLRKTGTIVDDITRKIRAMASTYLGIMGARALVQTADAMTGAENKLNYVNAQTMGNDLGYTTGATGDKEFSSATLDATASTMEKIFRISQQARTGYTDMVSNVSKSMMLAGNAFGNNVDNAIRFQQIMSEAYTVGGASAAEQASSMYQMVQALGSGILAGDELRSVREGAPLAYKAIEEFAQGVYDSTKSLKEMASEGMITSDIVVAGILSAGEKMDDAFQSTQMTFAQMWTVMKSSATHSFMPVFDEMRNQMNRLVETGFLQGFTKVMEGVATLATYIVKAIGGALTFIANNWYWLKWIALGVLTAITIAAGIAAANAIKAFVASAAALAPYFKYILLFAAIVAGMQLIMGKSAEMAQVMIAAILLVTTIWLMAKAIITGSIVAAILAIITAVFLVLTLTADSTEDAVGRIVGVITAAASVVWNLFVTLAAMIIKNAVVPLTTAWDTFANFFGNVFNDPIASIIRAFQGLAQSVLSILSTIASGIDSIFGSNLSGVVSGWQSGLASRANSLVSRYGNGTYKQKSNVTEKVTALIDGVQNKALWNTSSAYNTGYNFGSTAVDKIKEKLSGIANVGSMNGVDTTLNTDSVEDISNGLGDLNKTTGKISDKMDTTIEDLQYLRDLAELEWKKEYTVASINVDMTNNNNVSGTTDLDGIVTKLSDLLYQELNEVAEGVYTL